MHSKGNDMTVFFIDWHLPESGHAVDGGEDGWIGLANDTNALIHLLHGVFVHRGFCIEASEILDYSEPTPTFLWDAEDEGVVGRLGMLHDSMAEPFV